jgi:hypothetical protein
VAVLSIAHGVSRGEMLAERHSAEDITQVLKITAITLGAVDVLIVVAQNVNRP